MLIPSDPETGGFNQNLEGFFISFVTYISTYILCHTPVDIPSPSLSLFRGVSTRPRHPRSCRHLFLTPKYVSDRC